MRILKYFIVISLFVVVSTVFSSDDEVSPTPAPTKTPDVELTEEPTTETDVNEESNFEPFTQPDLNVLTGNVQRPNGITYYDGFLYTACTGDSTIYEIQSESGDTITYSFGLGNAHTIYVTGEGVRDLWMPD